MNILVVEASALHLGFLGCYGNDWVATPNLDRLAAEGIVFDQHIAYCPEPDRRPLPPREELLSRSERSTIVERSTIAASLDRFAGHAIGAIERARQDDSSILWIDGPS